MLVNENIRADKTQPAIDLLALSRAEFQDRQFVRGIANHGRAHDRRAGTAAGHDAALVEYLPDGLQHRCRFAVGEIKRPGDPLLRAARKIDTGTGLHFGNQCRILRGRAVVGDLQVRCNRNMFGDRPVPVQRVNNRCGGLVWIGGRRREHCIARTLAAGQFHQARPDRVIVIFEGATDRHGDALCDRNAVQA